jgi:hypothetical protein
MIKGSLFYHGDKSQFYGNIGDFAFEVDGVKYYIGDSTTSNFDDTKELIVMDCGNPCVMGFCESTKFSESRKNTFQRCNIKKYKSYTTLQDGEKHGAIVVHVEYINPNKRIKE